MFAGSSKTTHGGSRQQPRKTWTLSPEPRRPTWNCSGPGASKLRAKESEILQGSANAPATSASASSVRAARPATSSFHGVSSSMNRAARLAAHQISLIWCAASLAALFMLELTPWKEEVAGRAARTLLALALVAGAFAEPWRISLSFARSFEAPGPEQFQVGRLGSGESVHVFRGCCLDPPCVVFEDPANIYLRRPGDFSSGFCAGAGCSR